MKKQIVMEKISEIIPLFDGKRTSKEVGQMLTPAKSANTVSRYVKILRKAGYEVKTRSRGKQKLNI